MGGNMDNLADEGVDALGRGEPGENLSPREEVGITTLSEMLRMPPMEFFKLDLGLRNLLCATGLPDTRDLGISDCLKKLRDWIRHAKNETERNLHRFRESPGQYMNSEAYFRVGMNDYRSSTGLRRTL
jgi:hypothetical protein